MVCALYLYEYVCARVVSYGVYNTENLTSVFGIQVPQYQYAGFIHLVFKIPYLCTEYEEKGNGRENRTNGIFIYYENLHKDTQYFR